MHLLIVELSPVCRSACRRETKALQCVSVDIISSAAAEQVHTDATDSGGFVVGGAATPFPSAAFPIPRRQNPSPPCDRQEYDGGYCFEDQFWWRDGARKANRATLSSSDITYSILFEAVTTLLVFFSYQLFHKDILRDGRIYQHVMKGRWWEKPPPKKLFQSGLKSTRNFTHQLNVTWQNKPFSFFNETYDRVTTLLLAVHKLFTLFPGQFNLNPQ